MTNKTRKTIAIINTSIVALMLGGGAIAKLVKVEKIVRDFTRLGVADYIQILGASELLMLVLLMYPKTMRFGYLLLCGYLGGAMAVHLSHNDGLLLPVLPLVFITLSVFLRDRKFFALGTENFIND
jgi:hypothetical protein